MRNPSKSPLPARFHPTFPACKIKNATKILAESKEESFSQFFRRKPLVNFSGSFRSRRTGGPVGQVRDAIEKSAYRTSPTSPKNPNRYRTSPRVAAEHSPLWGRWRGLFPFLFFLPILLASEKNPYICSKHQT